MRASEILSHTPRDLDDGGKLLRIGDNLMLDFKTKNESSKRPVAVPTDLQPILAEMARDKCRQIRSSPAKDGLAGARVNGLGYRLSACASVPKCRQSARTL